MISLKSPEEGRLVLPKYRENSSCFSLCWLCLSFVICLFLQSRSSDCSSCLFQAFRYHPSLFFLLTFLCAVPTIQATVARPAPACEGHALLRAERRVRFEVVFTILASTARERWFTRDRRPLRVYTSSKLNKIIYCSLVPCMFLVLKLKWGTSKLSGGRHENGGNRYPMGAVDPIQRAEKPEFVSNHSNQELCI